MKRWRAAFFLAFLSALPILFAWDQSAGLLEDSDTKGILAAIRAAHDPLKWFRGDWPIANHFYRPIASLTFEADNALWGTNSTGYGLTNAVLCFLCVFALFWALREITGRPVVAALGSCLFSIWNVLGSRAFANYPSVLGALSALAVYAAWATLAVGTWRHRRDWRRYVPAFLTLLALSQELLPIRPLGYRMLDWIPGRTASTMTLFALLAIAAYARFERLRRPIPPAPEIGPETRPATRGTNETGRNGAAWPWAVVAVILTAVALGSYEQAVMLPAVLVVVAFAMRRAGSRPKWSLHSAFWLLLVGYLGVRWVLLPHDPSGYQRQQFSSNRTAFWAEMEYVFPPLQSLQGLGVVFEQGPYLLFDTGPGGLYAIVWGLVTMAVGYVQTRREPVALIVGLIGSAVAFLPMAWFKLFEHYHYWPMAMRTAFVVGMGLVAARLAATAVCPPARPAPPRPHPAPGSLPRP